MVDTIAFNLWMMLLMSPVALMLLLIRDAMYHSRQTREGARWTPNR